jgi:hypothetical protein
MTDADLTELRADALGWMKMLQEWMTITDQRLYALEKLAALQTDGWMLDDFRKEASELASQAKAEATDD